MTTVTQQLPPVDTNNTDNSGFGLPEQNGVIITEQDPALAGLEYMIQDDAPPLVTTPFGRGGLLLFAPRGVPSWALMNLILSLIGIVLAAVTLGYALFRRRNDDREFEREYRTDHGHIREEEEVRYRRYGLIFLVIAVIISIISIIIFVLTQDMRNMMVLLDWLTLIHVILLAAQIVAIALTRRGLSRKKTKVRTYHDPYYRPGETIA